MGIAAVGPLPHAPVQSGRGDGAVGDAERLVGAAHLDVVGAAEPDVAATVNGEAAVRRELPRGPVGRQALRAAAQVEPDAGRPGDRAVCVVDTDLPPAGAGRSGASWRSGTQGVAERSGLDADTRSRIARVLERAEQRGVGQSSGPAGAEQRGSHGVAQQRRGRDDRPGIGVQHAQLAGRVKARQPRGERLDPVAD